MSDELEILSTFVLELCMKLYLKWYSCILGIDVTANQEEISDHETFQLEYDTSTGRWYIRTMGDRYWTLETAGGIQASSAKKYENEMPRIPRLISFTETVIYDFFFLQGLRMPCSKWNGKRMVPSDSVPTTESLLPPRSRVTCTPTRKHLKKPANFSSTWSTGTILSFIII